LPSPSRRLRRRILFAAIDTILCALVFVLLVSPRAGLRGSAFRRGSIPARPSSARMQSLPKSFLWAWERREDLTFIDPRETGVAYLAETIFVSNKSSNPNDVSDGVVIRPRMQPLRISDRAALMAVARIEMRDELVSDPQASDSRGEHASLRGGTVADATHVDARVVRVAEAIARLAEIPGVSAVQVDFDATVSQRTFYSAMLRELRRRLPTEMPLSITALASWCYGDTWIDSLPIDEAVPMLFRMGVDDRNIRSMLAAEEDFHSPVCGGSLGFSTDEPIPVISRAVFSGRRIYWFHPRAWTAAAFHGAAQGVRK
jgi:hypothetical protein